MNLYVIIVGVLVHSFLCTSTELCMYFFTAGSIYSSSLAVGTTDMKSNYWNELNGLSIPVLVVINIDQDDIFVPEQVIFVTLSSSH